MNWDFLKNRYTQLGVLFFFLFAIIAGRLMVLQVKRGEEYRNISERIVTRIIPLKAPRGRILDRNGEVLAGNRPSFNVEVFQYELFKGDANRSILKAVNIIEEHGDRVVDNLPIAIGLDKKTGSMQYYFKWLMESEDLGEEPKGYKVKNWLAMYGLDANISAEQAFTNLRRRYSIDDSYSIQEARKVLQVWNEIKTLGYRAYQPVTIAKDIKQSTLAAIEEQGSEMPGIVTSPVFVRYYPHRNLASHVLGYIGRITQYELEHNREYLESQGYDVNTDLIGRSEMERVLDPYLHGVDGGQRVEVDVRGRTIRVLENVDPIPGHDVYLTIDLKLQRVAERVLEETMEKIRMGELGEAFPNAKAGSVVVVDVHTGAVLALANHPDFDPNFSATGEVDPDVWRAYNPVYRDPENPDLIIHDPTLPYPMKNNAVRGVFPPGSTFKMLVAIAGLQEGVIKPDTVIVDKGRYTRFSESHAPACWIWNDYRTTHGPEDVVAAIRDSCNYYFYEVGYRLGIEKIEEYAARLGLGSPTGVELYGEARGIVAGTEYTRKELKRVIKVRLANLAGEKWADTTPQEREKYEDIAENFIDSPNIKSIQEGLEELGLRSDRQTAFTLFYRYIRDNSWSPGKTLIASIGQAENTFSPLQMASYIATLANGGTRYKTYLVDRIISRDGSVVKQTQPEILDNIEIKPDNHRAVLMGMRAVTSSVYEGQPGTAERYFRGFPITVCGKTGTAQFKGHDAYGWFVSFAPYESPEIAVIVLVAQAGHGGYTAPIAREIYREYFELNRTEEKVYPKNQLLR